MKPSLFLFALVWPLFLSAQETATALPPQRLSRWDVPPAHYSGITPMGSNRYAVVSDKEPQDGFHVFRIWQDSLTGRIDSVRWEGFRGSAPAATDKHGNSLRDCEGVAFFPPTGTVFVSGEGDQQILEYSADGRPTGRGFLVPAAFSRDSIYTNLGFEALTYDPAGNCFWSTTESTLPADGACTCVRHPNARNTLRLQSFLPDGRARQWHTYHMELPELPRRGRHYTLGVPALCALPDGRLIVMERELRIPRRYVGASTVIRLFLIDPNTSGNANTPLTKRPLLRFRTRLGLLRRSFANYEGMCLGIRRADGRQTLLLISDSQGAAGHGSIRLRDFIKVVVLPKDF